jgi:hypothetical protein
MIKSAIIQNSRYGVKDRCLSFDGTDDYVDCGFTSVDTSQPFTYEMWFRKDDTASNIALGQNYAGTPREPAFQLFSNNTVRLDLRQANGINISVRAGSQDLTVWNHVAGVYDGTQTHLYFNGVLKDSENAVSPNNNSVNLFIGKQLKGAFFKGLVDEVRIWNHARTADQIKRYMNVRLTGKETGLVAYYPMNEGTGSTAYDKSTNSNDGTITGASWITP